MLLFFGWAQNDGPPHSKSLALKLLVSAGLKNRSKVAKTRAMI
jgi:hypothetical protein